MILQDLFIILIPLHPSSLSNLQVHMGSKWISEISERVPYHICLRECCYCDILYVQYPDADTNTVSSIQSVPATFTALIIKIFQAFDVEYAI